MKLTKLLKEITPLPYRVAGHEGEDNRAILSGDDSEDIPTLVADCYAPTSENLSIPGFYPDNARYLAHAANVLPEVLAALTHLANTADYLVREDYRDTPLDDAVKKARSMLAKAENIEI